ncbi:MAG: PEP-CTERM sorting domain-containing protein [Crocosphaera sp.]
MLKKAAVLGLFSTLSALAVNPAAQAAILWDWSFGGTESVRFTTDGDIADLASPGTFNITDFEVLASVEPSLVGANDSSAGNGFQWDGTQITQVFRGGGSLTNGANFQFGNFIYTFDVNISRFVDENDFDPFISESAFNPTPSAPTAESVPEPGSMLGLLGLGLGALAAKRKKQS